MYRLKWKKKINGSWKACVLLWQKAQWPSSLFYLPSWELKLSIIHTHQDKTAYGHNWTEICCWRNRNHRSNLITERVENGGVGKRPPNHLRKMRFYVGTNYFRTNSSAYFSNCEDVWIVWTILSNKQYFGLWA